jgi:D-psicose/D-tagatose/L-ribulose 3-epimerase
MDGNERRGVENSIRIADAEHHTMKIRHGLNLLVYTASFSREQVDLIPKVAAMGYDGVEIPFNDLDVLDVAATAKAREAAQVGLTACAVLMPGTSITSVDADERAVGVERLKRIVDITAEMGGDTVAGPLYAPVRALTGRARSAEEWQWAAEGLRTVAEHAEEAQITLAIEPLNRFETHVLNTAADAVRLVDEVGHPRLKVQLDTFHANIEEKDTAAAIRATGARLGHFHASESDRGVPGTGQVRWDECFAALHDTG